MQVPLISRRHLLELGEHERRLPSTRTPEQLRPSRVSPRRSQSDLVGEVLHVEAGEDQPTQDVALVDFGDVLVAG